MSEPYTPQADLAASLLLANETIRDLQERLADAEAAHAEAQATWTDLTKGAVEVIAHERDEAVSLLRGCLPFIEAQENHIGLKSRSGDAIRALLARLALSPPTNETEHG